MSLNSYKKLTSYKKYSMDRQTVKIMPKESDNKSKCVAFATTVLGDKWTPRLLFALSLKTLRFNELQTEAGGVNPTTLSDRLSDLERLGIITKTIYSEVPPRTEYNLTQKGKDLLPVLKHMAVWGEKYFGKC